MRIWRLGWDWRVLFSVGQKYTNTYTRLLVCVCWWCRKTTIASFETHKNKYKINGILVPQMAQRHRLHVRITYGHTHIDEGERTFLLSYNILINFYCFFLLLLFLPKKVSSFYWIPSPERLSVCNAIEAMQSYETAVKFELDVPHVLHKNNLVFDFGPFLRRTSSTGTAQPEQIWIWLSVERRFGYWISGVHMLSDSTYPWWCVVHNIVRICCHKAAPGHRRSRDIVLKMLSEKIPLYSLVQVVRNNKNHFPFAFSLCVDFGFADFFLISFFAYLSHSRARNKQQRKLKRASSAFVIYLEYIFITNCCYEKYLDARQSCERWRQRKREKIKKRICSRWEKILRVSLCVCVGGSFVFKNNFLKRSSSADICF